MALANSTGVIRLATLFVLSAALVCRAEDSLSGHWEGSIRIPERELTVVVDLARENDAWIGSITIPGLSIKGMPLAQIAAENSSVSFALKSGRGLEATFKGRPNNDGTFAGDFLQGGNTAPFTLKKTGPAQVERPPHSSAIAKEFEGEWKGEYEIFGYPRHVTIKLANRGSEGAVDFVIVGRKVNNIPVDLVTQEGELLTIDSQQTGIGYEGRVKKGANEINGTFSQGPIELPLVLRRTQ